MKLVWTQESINRLISIEEFIADDSPSRATRFITQIIKKTESLKKHPNKGRIVPEFSLPELREIIFKNYRIVYRLSQDFIEILTVLESHRLMRLSEIDKK
jgi:toxin ParE1/3/4